MSEAIFTAVIRGSCLSGRGKEALQLYYDMCSQNINPKLRTYSPLFAFFVKQNMIVKPSTSNSILNNNIDNHTNLSSTNDSIYCQEFIDIETCFLLYDQMTNKYHIQPSEREYGYMLQLCVIAHDHRFYEVIIFF